MPPHALTDSDSDADWSGINWNKDKGHVTSRELRNNERKCWHQQKEQKGQEKLWWAIEELESSHVALEMRKAQLQLQLAEMDQEDDNAIADPARGDWNGVRGKQGPNNETDGEAEKTLGQECEECKRTGNICISEGGSGTTTTTCNRCKTKKVKCSLIGPSKQINRCQLTREQKSWLVQDNTIVVDEEESQGLGLEEQEEEPKEEDVKMVIPAASL
ncbi:hypothetical protein C8R44DRAFT_723787 [Mycena epipterygia]|nr:hypothetical protein C8R44DRAFT_723787 [Mycena epipterygia]